MAQKQETKTENQTNFLIHRVYTKDISFESPNTPELFLSKWEPEISVDLHTSTKALENDNHEVVLSITVTAKNQQKVAFMVEVKQAGIFTISGLDEEQLKRTVGSFCPNIIFPYAREVISDLVVRGGFPQLALAPINFDMVYNQHLQQMSNQEKAS